MIRLRPSNARGHADHGWLKTYHSFSFAEYYDPNNMGFRQLRVLNEDFVDPRKGFPTHSHRDMEIITYVLEGELEHRDSMGNGEVIRPSDVQRMSAGTGVNHSEFNPSDSNPVHLLQIWIMPERRGITPSYEQKRFEPAEKQGRFRLIASPDGADGSVTINQDVRMYAGLISTGDTITHDFAPARHGWLQVARGTVTVNGDELEAGDAAAISDESQISVGASEAAEVILFDLA